MGSWKPQLSVNILRDVRDVKAGKAIAFFSTLKNVQNPHITLEVKEDVGVDVFRG